MTGFQGGTVQVANRVIDMIIAETAGKVDGVLEVKGYDMSAHKLRRSAPKYIETVVEDNELSTSLALRVKKGESLIRVVEEVQLNVKRQVEAMLGLRCGRVDIVVL